MPVLDETILEQSTLVDSHYGYSATRLEDLGASEYTLVTIACDVSGSTALFIGDIEQAITQVVQACRHSARADNLLLRLVSFDDTLKEIHGFKLLENCNLVDYGGVLTSGGSTALYDASVNSVSAISSYSRHLASGDFSANAIVFVITDGMDNASRATPTIVRDALVAAVTSESLESITSVLIGVNVKDPNVSRELRTFMNDAGFTQYVELDKADTQTLAKLADFVSRSISLQSQSLGSGGSSTPLVF